MPLAASAMAPSIRVPANGFLWRVRPAISRPDRTSVERLPPSAAACTSVSPLIVDVPRIGASIDGLLRVAPRTGTGWAGGEAFGDQADQRPRHFRFLGMRQAMFAVRVDHRDAICLAAEAD